VSDAKKPLTSVSYVMPVLNEENYLEAAVLSILAQEFEGPVEVILALGPSTDATDAIAENLALTYPVTLVRNRPGTTSAGLNAAIAAAKNDVVVRVDAHAKLMPGYTRLAVQVLNETGAANVGGVMKAVGHHPFQSAVAWAYNTPFGLGGGAFHVGGEAGPSDSVYLGVFRREVLVELGGFDPAVIRGQDWELNLRIRQSGNVVWFDPRLQVEYHPRSRWIKLARQFYDTGIWRGELTRRSFITANLRYFAPPAWWFCSRRLWSQACSAGRYRWLPRSAIWLPVPCWAFTPASGCSLVVTWRCWWFCLPCTCGGVPVSSRDSCLEPSPRQANSRHSHLAT